MAPALRGHSVTEARECGWATLKNGDLLSVAEQAGFDVLVTADKNIRYQQNLRGRKIAIVVLTQQTVETRSQDVDRNRLCCECLHAGKLLGGGDLVQIGFRRVERSGLGALMRRRRSTMRSSTAVKTLPRAYTLHNP